MTKPKQSKKKKNKSGSNSNNSSVLDEAAAIKMLSPSPTPSPLSPEPPVVPDEATEDQDEPSKETTPPLAKPMSAEEARSRFGPNADVWRKVCSSIGSSPSPVGVEEAEDEHPDPLGKAIVEAAAKAAVSGASDTPEDAPPPVAGYMNTIPEHLQVQTTPLKAAGSSPMSSGDLVTADIDSVTNRKVLDKLVQLYCFCVDKNLVVNVMAELYVVLELLTVQESKMAEALRREQKEAKR